MSISITDKPIQTEKEDLLKVGRYTQALVNFIVNSETPITIGLQGEWGTGKTSLMYMLRESLESQKVATSWVNTWEYSMFRGVNETTPAVLNGLVIKLKESCGDLWTIKDETENKIKKIGKFFGAISNQVIANQTGVDFKSAMSDSINNSIASIEIAEIKKDIADLIEKLIKDTSNPYQRVVFFVDDLDRIQPSDAVEVLEALKNIFDIPYCVFILAIDYDVVVKGLEGKFGPKTEENEREFRSFFDKIIQVPFSMPTGAYDIDHFLTNKLSALGVTPQVNQQESYTKVVRTTVGFNPRSLKRYLNSFSLLNSIRKTEDQNEGRSSSADQEFMLFALLGIQISYPKIFRMLAQSHDFTLWDAKFGVKCGLDWDDINQKIAKTGENEFTDEDWEKVVWGASQSDSYLKSRVFSILELLNFLRDKLKGDQLADLMEQAMQYASITAVDDNHEVKQVFSGNRVRYTSIDSFFETLRQKKYSESLIQGLEYLHNEAQSIFKDELEVAFTPNFLTLGCKNPSGRKRTFLFAGLKKSHLKLEFQGKAYDMKTSSDLSADLWNAIKESYNAISEVRI